MKGMEWYSNFFGIPYPFSKYDQLFSPEFNFGAMENVGLVTYNEAYTWKDKPSQSRRSKFCNTILHELAHMWFGNLVTMIWWDDLWLNESFATFISFLCQSQILSDDYTTTWIEFNYKKGLAYSVDQKSITHPITAEIADTDQSESHFDLIVYYKGSSFLKQMFFFIGETNFSNGLKQYFMKHAWGNTHLDHFVDAMAHQIASSSLQAGLDFDLKVVCKKWLSTAGLNSLTCEWKGDSNGKIASFTIKQAPCSDEHKNYHTHMFNVLLIHDDESVVKKILVGPCEEFEVKALLGLKSPRAVLLNYNDWGYFKWIVDKTSFDYLKLHLFEKITDDLSRQLFYKAVFDMTRDGIIPCTEYINLITSFLEKETQTEIISNVLRQTYGVIKHYLPYHLFIPFSEKMFLLVSKIAILYLNHKEMLMQLVDFIIYFAAKEEHVLLLKQWLSKGPFIYINDKMTVLNPEILSQEKRFMICSMCHQLPSLSIEEKEQLLAVEVLNDNNSDRSVKQKCKCRASLPDKAVKEEVWDMLIYKNNEASLYVLESYMDGFAPIGQLELIKEYCEGKFFEDVLKVEKKDTFFIKAFVSKCGPILFPTDDNIERLKAVAAISSSRVLKRELLELADDLRRFKKCQALCIEEGN